MRRLHRSWLFWLGLPGLVFLLWAWGGSLRAPSSGEFWSKLVCAKFINRAGTVTLAYLYPGDPFMGEDTGFYRHSLPFQAGAPPFPVAVERTKLPVFGDYGEHPPPPQLTLAYWSLLSAYLLLWMLAIYSSRRRVRKAIQTSGCSTWNGG